MTGEQRQGAQIISGAEVELCVEIYRLNWNLLDTYNHRCIQSILRLIKSYCNVVYFRSPEWKFISEEERKEIGLVFIHDGEFW